MARGTQCGRFRGIVRRRFIPAGAGNTSSDAKSGAAKSVYPRWRGEHSLLIAFSISDCGLSPLARGTLTVAPLRVGDGRFIPAGAGNTTNRDLSAVSLPVYPRWRGEHIIRKSIYILSVGLSPLARGTHIEIKNPIRQVRFIPAGAGNTENTRRMAGSLTVYPRWRGEHTPNRAAQYAGGGLSPLARGTQRRSSTPFCSARFIPAGAGNTPGSMSPSSNASVYPRWRGEHFSVRKSASGVAGLSPLARGTQNPPGLHVKITRFIPAGAGNTLSIHNCF
ncbi:hypothetical protein SSJG_02329 [Escherichia coli D9]|nr:hypothetical protein SSJG_02329 [Escherichia coli D9]